MGNVTPAGFAFLIYFLSIIRSALRALHDNCNYQLNNDILEWKKHEFFGFLTRDLETGVCVLDKLWRNNDFSGCLNIVTPFGICLLNLLSFL
jgi:hypothetical protein